MGTDEVCSKCLNQMTKHYKSMGTFSDDTESGTCATAYDWRQVQLCNGDVSMSCSGGLLIEMTNKRAGVRSEERMFFKPTYGRTDASTCVYGAAPLLTDIPSSGICAEEGNVEDLVRGRCNGKTSCRITRADLDSEIGNSACSLYQKYFKASYRCVKTVF